MSHASSCTLVLALALTACGGPSASTPAEEGSGTEPTGTSGAEISAAGPTLEVTLDGAPFTPVSVLVADYDAGDSTRRSIRFYDRAVRCADATFLEEGTRYVDLRVAWTAGEQTTVMVGAGDASAGASWETDGRFTLDAAGARGETVTFTVELPESTRPGEATTVALRGSAAAEVCL